MSDWSGCRKAAAVLDVYTLLWSDLSPEVQGRLLAQFVWEVCWDGPRRRFTVTLDELAITEEHARLARADDDEA